MAPPCLLQPDRGLATLAGAAGFVENVRKLGHSCALDDFGSGLSSFAYLRNLPVDYLKIDGQFVRNLADDPIDRVMGKKTIAEFAETEAVLERLRSIGVDFAQGYSIGYPGPLNQPN